MINFLCYSKHILFALTKSLPAKFRTNTSSKFNGKKKLLIITNNYNLFLNNTVKNCTEKVSIVYLSCLISTQNRPILDFAITADKSTSFSYFLLNFSFIILFKGYLHDHFLDRLLPHYFQLLRLFVHARPKSEVLKFYL